MDYSKSSGINCTKEDLPDLVNDRPDVTTYGWDKQTTYYQYTVR